MSPEFIAARRLLAVAYLQSGREAKALTEFALAQHMSGDDPIVLAWYAHARAVTGAPAVGAALLADARTLAGQRHVSSYHLAIAHTGLEQVDAAFAALDQAWLDRDPALPAVVVDPRCERLRHDARYGELLQRMRLGSQVTG